MHRAALALALVVLGLRPGLAAAPPEFELADLNGRFVRLQALPPGPKLINFWQRDCPPCREELPLLASFAGQHRHIRVITIALQTHAQTWHDRQLLPASGLNLVAPMGQRALLARFNNRSGAIPHTVWLDAKGAICMHLTGALTPEWLEHSRARCATPPGHSE